MMYLPSKDGQPDLTKLFVEMFGLVMPPKLAEEAACLAGAIQLEWHEMSAHRMSLRSLKEFVSRI